MAVLDECLSRLDVCQTAKPSGLRSLHIIARDRGGRKRRQNKGLVRVLIRVGTYKPLANLFAFSRDVIGDTAGSICSRHQRITRYQGTARLVDLSSDECMSSRRSLQSRRRESRPM